MAPEDRIDAVDVDVVFVSNGMRSDFVVKGRRRRRSSGERIKSMPRRYFMYHFRYVLAWERVVLWDFYLSRCLNAAKCGFSSVGLSDYLPAKSNRMSFSQNRLWWVLVFLEKLTKKTGALPELFLCQDSNLELSWTLIQSLFCTTHQVFFLSIFTKTTPGLPPNIKYRLLPTLGPASVFISLHVSRP